MSGLAVAILSAVQMVGQRNASRPKEILDRKTIAAQFFGNDAAWYLDNIPFLEIDDAAIQRTYYYRWQLYRSHLREIGEQGTDETEFLPSVPWARHPYEDLNDSSSFHILEGRWLRDPAYVGSLIDHLYAGGGNDRHFSESIAAATLAWTQVTGDPRTALRHLDAMQHVYNLWDDHFDAQRNLYWIEPLLDATEYTISSIDASGAGFTEHPSPRDNGFTGGYAFRPSINAFQYGNARAIAALARLSGQTTLAAEYDGKAERLRAATLAQLWNPALQHFTDIYQRSTATVKAGDFVRGHELVGYVPWQFALPPQQIQAGKPDYSVAWSHALSEAELGGPHGLRTAEPSYARYLAQYRYDAATGLPECQWNGPSWPFQTSQVLSGLANLLRDYPHAGVSATDYARLLRQYTHEHEITPGKLDLQEDYNPDTGRPIVGLPRSHHYNHSTYNDLVISGLLGIRPHTDDVFEMEPLLPTAGSSEPAIRYFALDRLRYHGHELTVIYDADGSRYHLGKGLSVFSDGQKLTGPVPLGRVQVQLRRVAQEERRPPVDVAVNVWGRPPSAFETRLPLASASSTAAGSDMYQAIDGRLWFFSEIAHGWSPETNETEAWYAVNFRQEQPVGEVQLAFFADGNNYAPPQSVRLQVKQGTEWRDLPAHGGTKPVPNGVTKLVFRNTRAQALRVVLSAPPAGRSMRLIAFRVYATSREATLTEN